MIDLRSDTVTKPTPAMKQAMMEAELGDDVLGDDPTVNRLQERFAELVGKEAALFVPSGSMGNEVCIRALTEPGDEIIGEGHSHFYYYEGAAPAALSGCQTRFVEGDRGVFTGDQVVSMLRPPDAHFCPTRLVVVENTHNGGGGKIWPLETVADLADKCHERGIRVHMDGARLMNACVASGHSPADYARHVDSLTMCFSKGLGAPVGSVVAGDRRIVDRAFRFRKMFGGGMRQAGLLAAACLYALDHNVERLAEDHENAKEFSRILSGSPRIGSDPASVETNLIYFDLRDGAPDAETLCRRAEEEGVRMFPVAARSCRAVTHLDVTSDQVRRAAEQIVRMVSED